MRDLSRIFAGDRVAAQVVAEILTLCGGLYAARGENDVKIRSQTCVYIVIQGSPPRSKCLREWRKDT